MTGKDLYYSVGNIPSDSTIYRDQKNDTTHAALSSFMLETVNSFNLIEDAKLSFGSDSLV